MTRPEIDCPRRRILATATRVRTPEGWAVVSESGLPISEVTSYLRHLNSLECSPNTLKAYASDLALYYSFLEASSLPWSATTNELLGTFIAYSRTPSVSIRRPSNPEGKRAVATVNRALAAISAFALFCFDAFSDQVYVRLRRSARVRTSFFTETGVERTTIGPRLRQSDPEMSLLSADEMERIIDACQNLRDKLIFSVLYETGMRIGQLLLLRHSDIHIPKSLVRVQRHSLVPGVEAQNKSLHFADVPVPPGLVKLYAAYMGGEYKFIDSDFVFVNLWAGRTGEPMKYASIEQLVLRLRIRSGVDHWSAHTFRHSYVTRLLAAGVSIKTVSYLVTHSSVATTLDTYDHVNVEDVRRQLLAAGIWSDANS